MAGEKMHYPVGLAELRDVLKRSRGLFVSIRCWVI